MGKKSKRKVTTKKPPVSESGGNNDGGRRPTNDGGPPQLQQQPWSILNSVYFQGLGNIQPYVRSDGSAYIPYGLGDIPCPRRSDGSFYNPSRAVATEGTYFAPSGYSTDLREPCSEFFTQIQLFMEPHVQEERRGIGSSHGTSRMSAEAERIATDARVLKKARQNKEAHDMYTRAIKIDPFNHGYFHHRSETAFNWKVRH